MKKSVKTYLKTAAKDYISRSVNPPVVRASTILFKTMQELRKFQKDVINKKKPDCSWLVHPRLLEAAPLSTILLHTHTHTNTHTQT